MNRLTNWRHHSAIALGFKKHYRHLLRWIRTRRLPQAAWRQYQLLCQTSSAAALIRHLPELPPYEERPFNKYLHNRLSGPQKLKLAMSSLQFIEQRFNGQGLHQLYDTAGRGIFLGAMPLKSGDTLAARLSCSPFPREGDLEISLWLNDSDKTYSLSFSATLEGTLYLAGLQGGRGDSEQIKFITKQSYGLRPKNLLMALVWRFARSFELNTILGIANQNQVKSRYIKSSYNDFWQEMGAGCAKRGWFTLPQAEPVKDIAAIKSSKRSEFRRRMALRDTLCDELAGTLAVLRADSLVAAPLVEPIAESYTLPLQSTTSL